jgi:hypothetical protein
VELELAKLLVITCPGKLDWWAQLLFSILWYWKVCKFSKQLENTSFTLENPYFLKNSQVFYPKILKVCWTKVMAIMNRVWIFNFVITRNLVNFSKTQKIIQIYMRKPKIYKNVPTLIQKNCKNLLEENWLQPWACKKVGFEHKMQSNLTTMFLSNQCTETKVCNETKAYLQVTRCTLLFLCSQAN